MKKEVKEAKKECKRENDISLLREIDIISRRIIDFSSEKFNRPDIIIRSVLLTIFNLEHSSFANVKQGILTEPFIFSECIFYEFNKDFKEYYDFARYKYPFRKCPLIHGTSNNGYKYIERIKDVENFICNPIFDDEFIQWKRDKSLELLNI